MQMVRFPVDQFVCVDLRYGYRGYAMREELLMAPIRLMPPPGS